MNHNQDEVDVRIGDHVRRRGLLAELFGEDEGTVMAIKHGEFIDLFEVEFRGRRKMYSSEQIILCKLSSYYRSYSSVTQARLGRLTMEIRFGCKPRSDL